MILGWLGVGGPHLGSVPRTALARCAEMRGAIAICGFVWSLRRRRPRAHRAAGADQRAVVGPWGCPSPRRQHPWSAGAVVLIALTLVISQTQGTSIAWRVPPLWMFVVGGCVGATFVTCALVLTPNSAPATMAFVGHQGCSLTTRVLRAWRCARSRSGVLAGHAPRRRAAYPPLLMRTDLRFSSCRRSASRCISAGCSAHAGGARGRSGVRRSWRARSARSAARGRYAGVQRHARHSRRKACAGAAISSPTLQ